MNLGKRDNKNKLRWRNFPLFLVEPLAKVGHFGETKYETFNFLKGQTVLDTIDCLKRHLTKVDDPSKPDTDEESGCHHLAHVAWNALVALYFIKTRPDLDDRFKGVVHDNYEKENNLKRHRFIIGDLVVIGSEIGHWEIAGLYYKENLEPVYMLRKDGQLREVKENHVEFA